MFRGWKNLEHSLSILGSGTYLAGGGLSQRKLWRTQRGKKVICLWLACVFLFGDKLVLGRVD